MKIEELEMDHIFDQLCIDALELRINTGAGELRVGEVIIFSPQDLKAHLVMTNYSGVDFGGFVCPYNILTHIQQIMKGEDTLEEVFKHKK